MDRTLCEDIAGIVRQWNRHRGGLHQVRISDARWNAEEQSLLAYEAVGIAGVPALVAVPTQEGAALGLSPETLWLSLWGELDPDNLSAFLDGAKALASKRGKKRVSFGGEEFHFVSGFPLESDRDRELLDLVQRSTGSEAPLVADFLGNLATASVEKSIVAARSRLDAEGWIWREVARGDHAPLHAFMSREFPGRWKREVELWAKRSDTDRAKWMLLEKAGETVGFARLAVRGRHRSSFDEGWTPGALRLPLEIGADRAATDGCLGPIGIAADKRGGGAGRLLLGLTLGELRREDARRICIDWTNAFDYYAALELARARNYASVILKVQD